jgi:3D-(3,5/4)-trihydroxycyclohexane-1,2-dione acylhydrolase (decyclizing)
VHPSVAYARQKDRLQTWACTASVGPGSTNMLTGAALATINRIPVLLLPSGTFATRVSAPVLQELEQPYAADVTVNDAFRPLSKFFDRVNRPEQLPSALLGAMRVLTDPVETGAVTIALPQDVQAEAFDWPVGLFAPRTWRIARPLPEAVDIADAAAVIRSAQRPLVVAGGGVHYSGAEQALRALCEATGIPVGESQAGKGSLPHGHPQQMGAIGSTGTTAANALAAEADVVIGIGTRWSDFTTASRTAFQHKDVRFVNLNVARFDAGKHSGLSIVADAREALTALTAALDGYAVPADYKARQAALWSEWDSAVEGAFHPPTEVTDKLADGLLTQGQVLGAVNELSDPRDVVLCAAGSMPGDIHKLWRVRDRKAYHVEYGYSCMGYEVPASIGIRLADGSRDVFAMVGDGGYLMMPTELVTAVQERVKVVVVLVQNHGFHSIGSLSESLGSQRFGTKYRFRGESSGRLDGDVLPVDLAANARSLGAHVIEVHSLDDLHQAVKEAKAWPSDGGPVVIHVETDPLVFAPDSASWWDVPVSGVSDLETTQTAYTEYVDHKATQRPLLSPPRADH